MKKFNDPAGILILTSNQSEWVGGSAGIPVVIHGYNLIGNNNGDGLWMYLGNEGTGNPVVKDVAQGSNQTAGRTIMFGEPVVFTTGCYVQADATTTGTVFYTKV